MGNETLTTDTKPGKMTPLEKWIATLGTLELVQDVGNVGKQTTGFGQDRKPVTDGSTYQRIAYFQFVPNVGQDLRLPVMRGTISRYINGDGGKEPTPFEKCEVEWNISVPLTVAKGDDFGTKVKGRIVELVQDAFRKAVEAKQISVPAVDHKTAKPKSAGRFKL